MKRLLLFTLFLLLSSAIHAQDTIRITVTAVPENGGEVSGGGLYALDTTCIVSATANPEYTFVQWIESDTLVSTDETYSFVVTGDRDLYAVFALALPVVDSINEPDPICAGDTLVLTAPGVSNIFDETYWQLSETESFENPIVYKGENLDETYNGWRLRYCAINESGEAYSNIVTITVNYLNPILTGSNQVCSNEMAEYYVEGADNAIFQWWLSDSTINIIDTVNPLQVLWAVNADTVQVSVFITDTITGCTATLDMNVNVTSHVSSTEELVGRKKDGVTYLLIYPNPDSILYRYQWYHNGNMISCDKQFLYNPVSEGGLEPGTYQVYVSFNEGEDGGLICGAFSPEYSVEPSQSPMLSIYPNPSHPNSQITVINEESEPAILSVYSVDGRLLHQQSIEGYQVTVNLDLAKGFYIAQLKNSQSTKTGRIVIE